MKKVYAKLVMKLLIDKKKLWKKATYGKKISSKSVQGLTTNEIPANQEFCPLEKLSKSDKSYFITGGKIYLKC